MACAFVRSNANRWSGCLDFGSKCGIEPGPWDRLDRLWQSGVSSCRAVELFRSVWQVQVQGTRAELDPRADQMLRSFQVSVLSNHLNEIQRLNHSDVANCGFGGRRIADRFVMNFIAIIGMITWSQTFYRRVEQRLPNPDDFYIFYILIYHKLIGLLVQMHPSDRMAVVHHCPILLVSPNLQSSSLQLSARWRKGNSLDGSWTVAAWTWLDIDEYKQYLHDPTISSTMSSIWTRARLLIRST